ncbi:tRNA-dihydrouridine(47) synthase [NAD(P)(+)]-like [Orchesella cincta]|uniref:tRNA-dihydrouridine(47) synthase [NAD(P)(+)] n=1 Tax=Orchesella cincta TaxID=48709 RepID=A0A1D2MXG0_ORCCI|nr:tRNA-dihydrouridine(47) synthase [NAD(P)(+)]-like [Orchesella cincta]
MAAATSTAVTDGIARIKPEFIWIKPEEPDCVSKESAVKRENVDETSLAEPEVKKLKIEGDNVEESDVKGGEKNGVKQIDSRDQRKRGQNKAKDRPLPKKAAMDEKLCPHLHDGPQESKCPHLSYCSFIHDLDKYLSTKPEDIKGSCYIFETYGKCPRGVTCRFSSAHVVDGKNVTNEELWKSQQSLYESGHNILLPKKTQIDLRRRNFDFKPVEKIWNKMHHSQSSTSHQRDVAKNGTGEGKLGPVSDEDLVSLRPKEMKKIDWNDKLYLSPLTTVGNLPFRRLCVEFGADITCSEMSLATSLLQGNAHEFALHRRHPSEKIWGVQLCSNNGFIAGKAAHLLAECGIEYDFVDLNMGCPIDSIYRQGAGSGLMNRFNKFNAMVRSMVSVLGGQGKPFTVKMRKGVHMDKNIADKFILYCRNAGVSLVTLHGRSREQRYLKTADWNYITDMVKMGSPMPVYGNGDILSWEEYNERKALSNAPGVMIGRGALIKPWIFQEIKEQRHIDMTSTHRMEILQKFVNYGLDHWGSDSQGVTTTRRFFLEFQSFFHRYIPYGILEDPPQKVNQRPPRYVGRDEMETLLCSGNAADWIKLSEIFLGSVPSDFVFVPKHKASSW